LVTLGNTAAFIPRYSTPEVQKTSAFSQVSGKGLLCDDFSQIFYKPKCGLYVSSIKNPHLALLKYGEKSSHRRAFL
jgi:hypothetical protein